MLFIHSSAHEAGPPTREPCKLRVEEEEEEGEEEEGEEEEEEEEEKRKRQSPFMCGKEHHILHSSVTGQEVVNRL